MVVIGLIEMNISVLTLEKAELNAGNCKVLWSRKSKNQMPTTSNQNSKTQITSKFIYKVERFSNLLQILNFDFRILKSEFSAYQKVSQFKFCNLILILRKKGHANAKEHSSCNGSRIGCTYYWWAYNFICKFPLAPLQHHHSTSFIN